MKKGRRNKFIISKLYNRKAFFIIYTYFIQNWKIVLPEDSGGLLTADPSSETRTKLSAQSSIKSEKDVFLNSNVSFDSLPSWVAFPDFDR